MADEEARQWRAFNFLFSVLNIRGAAAAELCHPLWNDYKRSLSKAGLLGTLLKATAVTNFGHGPFLSGKRFLSIGQAAEKIVHLATTQYFQSITDRVCFDRGWSQEGHTLTRKEFLLSRAVRNRLPFAPLAFYCFADFPM